jgi:hypothetical protein
MSTNGITSSALFTALFDEVVDACATVSAAADLLMLADPVTEFDRVQVLVDRMRVLVALARRVEEMDVAGDTFDHLTLTAEESALLADPLAA